MYAVGNYLNSSMSFVQIESMLTHICFNLGFMQKKKKNWASYVPSTDDKAHSLSTGSSHDLAKHLFCQILNF